MVAHEEIERFVGGDVNDSLEFADPFGRVVNGGQRLVEVVGDVFVELLILLLGDLAFRSGPDRLHRVECLFGGLVDVAATLDHLAVLIAHRFRAGHVHHHGILHVIGVLLDDGANAPLVQIFFHFVFQVQHDLGAASLLLALLYGVAAVAGRFPAAAELFAARFARGEYDLVRDHEGGVKADAELADQFRIVR